MHHYSTDSQVATYRTGTDQKLIDDAASRIGLIGRSQSHVSLLEKLATVASVDAEVLLIGETGVGKELYARFVHRCSHRSEREMVAINCAAIQDSLFENELFGHGKGAYTDARSQSEGLIALAEGGTLFLDEVHQLSPSGQVKLLRLLQEKTYRRLGDRNTRKADFRLVSAMNCDPQELLESGKLRRDLFHRLNVVTTPIAPLRDRAEDIVALAEHFFIKYCNEFERKIAVTDSALRVLAGYDWPGNIRELQNMIKSIVCQTQGGVLDETKLPFWSNQEGISDFGSRRIGSLAMLPFAEAKKLLIEEFEMLYVTEMLKKSNGNVCQAARFAGKPTRSFRRTMNDRGVDVDEFRSFESGALILQNKARQLLE